MEEENSNLKKELYFKSIDSEEYQKLEIEEMKFDIETSNKNILKTLNKIEYTFKAKFNKKVIYDLFIKPYKTISKKRFIKLLMSKGIQRNYAYSIDKLFIKFYKSRYNYLIDNFLKIMEEKR